MGRTINQTGRNDIQKMRRKEDKFNRKRIYSEDMIPVKFFIKQKK